MQEKKQSKDTNPNTQKERQEKILRRLEIISAILISLATVASAWCAYQSALWGGEESISYNAAGAARTESVRYSNQALQLLTIDVNMFTQFAAAYSNQDEFLFDFLMARFRPEMKVAVEAWLETEPLKNPDAPASPFDMVEYQSEAQEEADRLLVEVDRHLDQARQNDKYADRYVLLTVIFASVLFFGGMSSEFKSLKIRTGLVAFSTLTFLVTLVFVLTFPII
ncbi:MAG: hypothetical protein ACK2U1_24880 [Anaerolineales bacterium]